MKRRNFLKAAGALPLLAYFPFGSAMAASENGNILILVQLGGGNDSLNTFVPYADANYYAQRDSLAIGQDEVLPLTNQLGLNPVMSALQDSWDAGEMAIVQGLGYPEPNRSHFRSIEIWQTASDHDEFLNAGWISQLLPDNDFPLQALVLGGSPGAFAGEPSQLSASPASLSTLESAYIPDGVATTQALNFVMQQRQQYNDAIALLSDVDASSNSLSTEFANDSFSQQCEAAAKLLAADVKPCVIHLSLGSFDTHSNQRNAHDNLLEQMSVGLATLREELTAQGLWQQVTVASYAEFGRRLSMNASNGTDHGTAASHFVLGGSVQGGVYGTIPSLSDLDDNNDLIHTTDFRRYYRTLSDWMEWQASEELSHYDSLTFV